MLIAKGTARSAGDWMYVQTDFEAHYMTYLAKHIAEENGLSLGSDCSAAWTAATYFQHDGEVDSCPFEECPAHLATIVVRDFIPENICAISPDDLLEFRSKRRHERRNFVRAIRVAAKRLSQCREPAVAQDMLVELKRDIEDAMETYRKSADLLKVTGWSGLQSLSFPILTGVLAKLVKLDPAQMLVLSAAGIAMGAVTGLTSLAEKQRQLSRSSDYSYLVHLHRRWSGYRRADGYNGFLWDQMEEFIND